MDKEQTQRDFILDLKNLEVSLKEQSDKTFLTDGYNQLNQLQRVLLELVKEQIGYEDTNSTTSKTR